MSLFLKITPRDPLVARDGRPFGAGASERMRSLDWPYPSVLAGSLRTLAGKLAGGRFDPQTVADLKRLAVAGPLPLVDGELYFPVPADFVVRPDGKCLAARPAALTEGEGCDLPDSALRPVLLALGDEEEDFKPAGVPRFFSRARLAEWLCGTPEWSFDGPKLTEKNKRTAQWRRDGFLPAPPKDERWHVRIERESGALAARVDDPSAFSDQLQQLAHLHPLGGERRLAHWEAGSGDGTVWECPANVREALAGATKIRMVLATPAIFSSGWRPGWLEESADGAAGVVPGTAVRVKLVGATIERWQPVSGWSLEEGRFGPKPVWRLVPAGGVYFFEVLEGEARELAAARWMKSVCDEEQHRRDGFGLAVWGVWGGD